jgi:hypothetical protein
MIAPVVGSGSWPAWMARVSKRMAAEHIRMKDLLSLPVREHAGVLVLHLGVDPRRCRAAVG